MKNKETKAERIYNATRWMCKDHLKTWGFERNPNGEAVGFTFVATEESISTRTLNAIEKELEKDRKRDRLNVSYEIITEEELQTREQIREMVQTTINNTRKALIV